MAIDEHLTEHARGAMIGLAIGDALGMPTQSMSAEQIIECYGGPVRRLMDAVPQQPIAPNMKAGSVTDDTEQAFVLAARLIDRPLRPSFVEGLRNEVQIVVTVLSIAPLIARAIREVFDDGSVTSLFDGNA